MLKRIAGNLFWLTRYLERAEWRARLLDVNYRLLVENPAEAKDEWWPLLAVTGEWDLFAEHYTGYDERSILAFFTFDPHNLSSIASCIENARENCRAARNRISSELWLEINTLHLEAKRWTSDLMLTRGVAPFFAELRERFYRISGAMQSTLPRDSGYDFLNLGRWLEAAENVTRLLDTKYHFLLPSPADAGSPLDLSQWAALLRSASALEAYRNAYGNSIAVERVVEFMLFDQAFPRAARFCVERLELALNRIASSCPAELQAVAENPAAKVPTAYTLGSKELPRRRSRAGCTNTCLRSRPIAPPSAMKSSTPISNLNNLMRYRIRHVTRFTYEQPAHESHNEIRLQPRDSVRQRTLGFRLETTPPAAVINYRDAFGNTVHAISIHPPHTELMVCADSLVERMAPRELPNDDRFEHFLRSDRMRSQEEYDFLSPSRYIPFSEQLKKFFWMVRPRMNEPVADYSRRVVAWVCDQFAYEPGTTDVHSDVNQVLSAGAGVCQDFAHLTIGVLRLAGVPARYVSGYLAPRLDRNRPLGDQASHAWLEVMLPEGWFGFDPTHGSRVTDHHIRLAVGRDYADVSPVRGVYRSAGRQQTMRVSLDITEADPGDENTFDQGAIQQ